MKKTNYRKIRFADDKKNNYFNFNFNSKYNLNKLDKNMCILEFMIISNKTSKLLYK